MSTQGFSRAALKLFVLFVMVTWSSVLLSQISFVETEMSFMDMDAQMDVGDFDNDGDLDLLLSGSYGTAQSTYGNGFVKIYVNNNGIFEPTAHSFIQPFHNFSDWADYDNDGDLDVVIFGAFSSAIYRNDGGSFTNIGSLFNGWHGTSDWGDYDNDGDLDLVKAGYGPASRIYRNDNGSFISRLIGRKSRLICDNGNCINESSILMVDANGDIYPCEEFIGYQDMIMHNVHSIEVSMQKKTISNYLDSCSECILRPFCGGICPRQLIDNDYSYCKFRKMSIINYLKIIMDNTGDIVKLL